MNLSGRINLQFELAFLFHIRDLEQDVTEPIHMDIF
jgi:hypothetical protein